jgi:hypothetical protein
MASTKDLYDELKGNPLVNVKDDYETFNAKLKDPNFLKRLDEVMTKFGKDINAYDIPKKKKDGEDESSQPTEQPSANTEPTQADGVEPEGRPKKGEPGYNRKIGPDEAFISQGWIDRGTWWEHPGDGTRETRQVIYKPIKEEEEQVQMPATDVQEQPEQIEQPERPETPETDFQGQPERPETPTTDLQGQPERAVVPENSVQNVISQQEPDPVKSNKIVTDANFVSGNTFKRKKKDSDFKGAVITYTPDSASDQVFIYEQGKVRSMDKRSNDYSDIIAKNPYTVQLKNSDAFKDLIQLQKEGNKQAYQNYLETIGNPAAREIADFSFGAFSPEEVMLPTIMSGSDVDRNIPVNKTLIGKLKTSNLYNAAEGLWNNIINKEVDRPWQKEEVYDADEFINNVDPNLSDEERQAQSMFDSQMAGGTEEKGPRQLKFPSYVYKKEDNEIVTEEEQKKEEKKKRASIDFLTTNPETGELELGDVNDLTEIERYNLSKAGSKAFLNKWEEEKAKEIRSEMADTQFLITGKEGKRYKSDFLNNPANQAIYNKIKDSKFAPQQGGSELEIALATISNKQANADFKNLHENGYKDAYSTQIRTPYDIQNELDNIDKILDSQPNMSYDEKMKLYKQKESLNQALLNVYEQNIQDYATYLRNTGHEKAAADMLSTYDYYKKKTGGFQTLPVKELNDADKRAIMNIRGQAINTTMRYLQAKYQTLSNTVDISGYQKLAQKPLEQVAKQFEILKSIGALDENGNINPSAKIKQSDQVKLSDAILKINLAKDQIASAAEATGANPENINELTRLGEKLGNLQNTQTSFYQKNAMEDLREEDENDKRNQKIAEDRMKSEDFFTSFFYTALYGGSNLIIPGLSTLAKIGKVPDIIADALGDETQLFDQWSAYIDEMIKDMTAYQPQDMTGLSGMQKFWLNTTAGISNLGAYAASGLIGGPALTTLLMLSDQTDQAKAEGLDDDQAAAWGLFMSMVLGRINQLVPDSKSFYDALKPSTKIILKEWSKGKLTRPEAMGMLSKAIVPSLQKHFNRTLGEFAEESLEEVTNQLGGMAGNLVWDNASFNKDFDINSIISSGESGASITAVLAPFQKGGKRSVVEQNVLLSFSQNKNYILRNISFESQDELNEINKQLTELEAMEVGLQSMPGYTELSNGKKAEVLSELYRAKGMELAAKNRGLGKNDPGFIEAEKIREDVLNSLKTPEKGEVPTQTESQKPETNAVQEPSTTEVLPSQQGEVRETGRKRQGMEPSVQGEEVTEEARKEEVVNKPLGTLPIVDSSFFDASKGVGLGYLPHNVWTNKKLSRDSSFGLYANLKLQFDKYGKDAAYLYFLKPNLSKSDLDNAEQAASEQQKTQSQRIQSEGYDNESYQESVRKDDEAIKNNLTDKGIKVSQVGEVYRLHDPKTTELAGYLKVTPELLAKISDPNISEEEANKILFDAAGVEMNDGIFIHINENDISKYEAPQEGGKEKVNSTEESQAYVDKLTEVKNNAPEDYWSVSIPEVEDVENGTIITNEDGQAVVGADGDIKAVYKNPDSEAKRVSDTLLKEAIKAGGIKLDNFDIYLTKIYKENGFKIVSRLPFNEDYAPDGWNKEKHGTPDVVAMIYDPENKLNIEEKQFTNEQYDEAMAYRDTYVDAQKEAYKKEVPAGKKLFNEPNPETAQISEEYKNSKGIEYGPGENITKVDTDRAMKIADAYEALQDSPNDPEVKKAYDALINETLDQFKAISDKGYKIELWDGQGEPYASSEEMIKDLKDNKHMYIFSTEQGFGNEPITDKQRKQYRFLDDSGFKDVNGKTLLNNDIFRFVHDFFGHSERGNGFGPVGEENAWDVHARMYSPLARRAMTTGTRGQNSWVNFGPQMRNEDGTLKKKGDEGYLEPNQRAFAPPKMGLLPEEFSQVTEVASDTESKAQEERKSIADQVRSLKSEDGRAYSAALGIPIAIWDGAVELIATSIEAGESFVNAINKAKEYLKQQLGDDYNEDIAEEFMDEVINQSPLQLNNTDKVKGTPVRVNPDGHNLSFVKEEDLIDIDALIKDIEAKGETVWFWVADQLGRGYYMDSKTGNKHYLDAGPSYALDPKNRKKKVIWASGVTEKTLNKNIKKADYIFIISGSPEKSKLFNKAVFQVFQEKIGDYNTFKKEVLANKPIKGIKEVLEAHDSWESLIEDASVNGKKGKIGTGRKKFLNELVDASKKPNSSLYKVLKDRDALVNVDDLRDGFYADNNFQQNDIMLVLKPEKLGDKSEHSTYENDLMGEVVGVPNKKINAYEILPNKLRGKKGLNLSKQSSKTAPYGSGLKPVSASQNIARGLRQSADLIRKGKRGGLAMNPIDPFLEVIAKALEAGASLTEAIAKGLEAFKNSDFYKNLTAQEKSKAVNDLKKAMDEQIAPTIANLINEEMLKGKGVYTASQNVKNQMIKEGIIDEATFDRIVGKAEKIVKAQAEQMIVDATDKAVEDIRSGAGLDNALNALSDFINNEIGFYKSQDKTLKKDLTDKARKNVIDELSSKIAGDAKSYMEVDNMSKADAIEKALGDATSSGMEFSTVDQLRDSVKNSIDKIKSKDAAEARKNEPVVTTTDKEIMKDKLKAMDSALKEAVAKAKQDKKDEKEMRQLTRNWVKDYLKTSGISAKISPVQMRAIVSRATGVVSDMTDAKMKALTDYVEKVVANQEYAQMINDLEKNKKGASKKRHNQYTEAVRKYLSLPLVNSDGTPLMNDQELKAYAESVARLNQSVPDHSRMDMNLATRVLNDYNEIPSKLEKSDFNDAYNDIKTSTIDDLSEYNEFVKKVNKAKRILDSLYNNGKVTEDEYNDALNELYTKENGLRVYEQQHQDQIDDLKENMIDDIVDMSNYVDKSGFIGQQGEVYKRLEVMLKKPEMLMSLDVKDIVKLTEVMDRMADGFVAEKELREIVNKAETRGQKKGESIVNQLASIYKSLNSPDLTKLRNLLKLTEPAQIERVLGLSSGPIYNNVIQPINSAFTKMRKNTERLMDDYYKARQESKFKGDVVVKRSEYDKGLGPKISDKITVKADKYYSTRVAMLSSIFDYASKAMDQKADTKDFWGENLEKADVKKAYHNDGSLHIVNDIYSKLSNDPRFQTNGKLDYTKIYEAFLTDPKSVMSEAEYKLYEATQRINKTEIGEALVSANAIRGINGEISAVHYPRKSLGKSSAEDADLVAGTGGKVGGLRAGSSYARVLETPKDAIDLNLDRVMATQIYEASRDLYLNDAIQQTNEVFRNAKENANPDEKAILQAIQDWNRKRVDFELEKSAKNVITRAFGGFASYALIGKVRTPAEFATNLLSGVFNQLSNLVKIGPKALISPVNPIQAREALKLMEKFDSPVQFMGWTMKSYAKYGKGKVDKDNLSSFYNNAVNMLMNISGPLTAGEWKSDFDAKFKELTGEKYNEAKHLENDEYFYAMQQASSYANQQIERIKGGAFKGQGKQFVAVNPITDIKKLFPGVKIKDEEGMVSSSETFAQMTNIFNNFVGRDVKNFVSGAFQAGTGRDISGGIKDMIGSSYRLGSYYLIYNLIDAAMKSALGDDEEKKKGGKKMEMFTTEEGRWDTAFNTVLNFVTTVATSKYGANGRAIAVGYLNYLYNSTENKEQKQMASDALASMYFQEPVETGQYGAAEKFIYMATTMYIPPADVIANQAQKEFDRLSGSDKYKGATITDFFDQAGKFFNDPEVVEYRKFLAGGLTLMSQIGVVTGINLPFVKDAVKLIKKDVQDKQNIVILNKNGENMVEGVLDFDIDGNAMVSVTVDVPGMPADQKKVLNETLSNSASDKFNKLIEKNKERVDKMPENNVEQEAEKFALVQYYHDLAVHQAKVEAKLAKPEEAPKEPSSSSDYFESQEQKKKWVEAYQAARATGKFSSASKLSTSKDLQEGVQKLIDSSPYKDSYNALDPKKVENVGAIKAMNTYFNDLYKYNVTPVPGKEPKASDYFYKDYNGKITPVE